MFPALALLFQALPVQHFPMMPSPGSTPDVAVALHAACPAGRGLDRAGLLAYEVRRAASAAALPTAANWTALGCARALLWDDGAISHDGPLMVSGDSWAVGGLRALLEALKQQPTGEPAARVLALLALDDESDLDALRPAVTAALGRAVAGGVHDAATLRGCSYFGMDAGDTAAVRQCAAMALRAGVDSTWHEVALTRLAFRDADTALGTTLFLRAVAAAHDTASRDEITWQLQWFLTPDEEQEWTTLPASARASWVRDRLASRDVRDGQPPGARLAEQFKRLEYVLANFRLHPARVMDTTFGRIAATPMAPHSDSETLHDCEPGLIAARPYRYFVRWDTRIDDRGVVWMRFGKPDERTFFSHSVCHPRLLNPRELWKYDVNGQTLLLDFEGEEFGGSVEATRLVTGVLGTYMCDIDPERCYLTNRAESFAGLPAERLEALRFEDAANVAKATTTDDNSPRGLAPIETIAHLHRLWDPVTGERVALVTYALKSSDLAIQHTDTMRTAVVDLSVRQWAAGRGTWSDTTIPKHLRLPDTTLKRTHLTGFVLLPSEPGVTSWSVVATQPAGRRGISYDVSGDSLGSGPLALSDLVIGAASQGLVWNNHGAEITLAPLDAVNRIEPLSLYYQINSTVPRPKASTNVVLYRIQDGRVADSAALQVVLESPLPAGISETAPLVDVSRLPKGSYRLDVRLTDGAVSVRRSTILDLE